MKFILKYIGKYKGLFAINIIAIVMLAAAELGIPFLISNIVDKAMPKGNLSLLYQLIIMMVGVAVIGSIGNVVLNYCASRTSAYILKDMRNDVFGKIQTLSVSDIQEFGTSSLLTRTMADVFQILNFVTTFYRSAVLAPMMFIFSIILIIIRAPQLSVSILTVAPIIVLILFIVVKITKTLSERQQEELDQLNLITRENLTGVRVIRAFRKSKYEQKRFAGINNKYTDTSVKMFRIMVSIEPVFYFFFNLSILVLMYFGTVMIDRGSISLGQLIEFLDYQFHVMFSILTFSLLFMMYPKTMVSSARIKAILDKEPSIKNNIDAQIFDEKISSIEFKGVSFRYPDADESVLTDISLKVEKGQRVAFVGSTGSGKSTLIQLIPRLYDVTEGAILVNGKPLSDYDIKELRNKIGYILQKALLFEGTIRSNLLFGNSDATEEDMFEALDIAQGRSIIDSKPEGLDAYVSELGTNLSGGQRQRLSIARALVKKPDIYIFDDSFSALDYKTDVELRSALFEKTTEDIVLIVAQRLSSVMNSDKIVVMHQGKIVDIGTHHELLDRCQIYQEIARSQNLLEVV